MLAKCVLASPAAGHRLCWREILKLVRSHIQRWLAGDLVALWSEAVAEGLSLSRHSQSSSSPSQRSHNIKRAKLAIQDGQYSKAIKTLTSDGLATPSAEVMQEMLTKHPQTAPPALPPGPVPPPSPPPPPSLSLSSERELDLSPMARHPDRPACAQATSGKPWGAPPLTKQTWCLLPSPGSSISWQLGRPRLPSSLISVVPRSWPARRRKEATVPSLLGRCCAAWCRSALPLTLRLPAVSLFSPLQMGVSVRGGCEAIVHATSRLMSSLPDEQRWTLLLDFKNAFNSINREAMFVEFRRCLPGLSAWMESCYSCQPLLHLGTNSIRSCCGVQQGDPLGPLGFALTLHPIVERIKAEVPALALNAWYLDDGTLVGRPGDLSAALHTVETEDPPVGLHLNRGKSLLFVPRDCDASLSPLPPEVPVTRAGFCLLGCPIGPPSCEQVLQDRVVKIREALGVLLEMGDAQMETTLLRSCFALPKFSYLLCTCPPTHISKATVDFDVAMREALESILGGPLSGWSWLKASLSSSHGGVNLRSASLHAPAAFLASSLRSQSLVGAMLGGAPGLSTHTSSTMAALSSAASRPD